MAETSLHAQKGNTTSLKFNGKLDVTEENTASLTELNIEGFLRGVGDVVKLFGLETFFYLPDSGGIMKYLPEDPHTFTLASVLAEHESRIREPTPILEEDGKTGTPTSIISRFKFYDDYEMCSYNTGKLVQIYDEYIYRGS